MTEFSREFLEETVKVWEKYSPSPLSLEDAREIAENMIGLYSLILELEQEHERTPKGLCPTL